MASGATPVVGRARIGRTANVIAPSVPVSRKTAWGGSALVWLREHWPTRLGIAQAGCVGQAVPAPPRRPAMICPTLDRSASLG